MEDFSVPVQKVGNDVNTTGIGDVIRYTCPAKKIARFVGGLALQTAAATIKLQYLCFATGDTYDLASFTAITTQIHKGIDFPLYLMPGDQIAYRVTTGLAGLADGILNIEELT